MTKRNGLIITNWYAILREVSYTIHTPERLVQGEAVESILKYNKQLQRRNRRSALNP